MKTIQKLKTAIIVQTLIIGLLIAFLGYVLAQGGTTFTLSQGIYPGASSYTIWREGSTYYAKNAYGAIDYSGTNASQVLQNAINTAGKGKIALVGFSAGNPLVISSTITLKNHTWIEGEGMMLTHIYLADGSNVNMFETEAGTKSEGIILRNIALDGNKAGQTATLLAGIYIDTGAHVLIDHVYVVNVKGRGIVFGGSPTYYPNWVLNSVVYGCDDGSGDSIGIRINLYQDSIVISNNIVAWCGGPGILTYGVGTRITHNHVWANQYGIWVESNYNIIQSNEAEKNKWAGIYVKGDYNVVNNNEVYNNDWDDDISGDAGNGAPGIFLDQSNSNTVNNNVIYDTTNTQNIGILVQTSSDKNTINGNNIDAMTEYGLRIADATCNYNAVIGNTVMNSISNIIDEGTNNEIHNCWNGTTWIP